MCCVIDRYETNKTIIKGAVKVRLAIDVRYMSKDMENGIISSGVGRFFVEVLEGMIALGHNREVVLIAERSQKEIFVKLFPQVRIYCLDYTFKMGSNIIYYPIHYVIDSVRLMKAIKRINADVVWFPFTTPYTYLETGVDTVSTIHDIIPFRENPRSITWKLWGRRIIRRSKVIVADSKYVRKDIIDAYRIKDRKIKQKICAIPSPVVVDISQTKEIKELKERSYILDINAYQERKNAITLLKAFSRIADKIKEDLVFCGGFEAGGLLQMLKAKAWDEGLAGRVHFFFSVPMSERNWLLKNAALLVSPSLSEGFGRTPIEAAIVGIPVLTTKVDSLYEVTGGLLHYYEPPEDDKILAKTIEELLGDIPPMDALRNISGKFVYRYAPERVAKMYWEVMEK